MDVIAKVELAATTGMDADKVTNTFAFTGVNDLASGTLGPIADKIEAFWTTQAPTALLPLAKLISSSITRSANACAIKFYDVTGKLDGDTPAGSPVFTRLWTMNELPVTGLPNEVAFALTLEGLNRATTPVEAADGPDAGSAVDRPQSRRTGRLYLGPLSTACASETGGTVRPGSNIRDTALYAAKKLAEDVEGLTGGVSWAVWSRADAAMYVIEDVSADNAFDTIRSRGPASTVRTRVNIF